MSVRRGDKAPPVGAAAGQSARLWRRRTVDGVVQASGAAAAAGGGGASSITHVPLARPGRKRSGSVGNNYLPPARPASSLSFSTRGQTPTLDGLARSSSSRDIHAKAPKSFKTNFRVTVRVRPPLERELRTKGAGKCVEVQEDENALVIRKPKERGSGPALLDVGDFGERLSAAQDQLNDVHSFAYDRIYGMISTQEEVYTHCAHDIVHSVLQGYNGSIIAYGQTSTGKTHTIEGEGGREGEARGVIPRCCEEIFDYIQNQASQSSKFLVRTSFLEIYNEQVMDLLEPGRTNLKVRETPAHGMYVEGLSEKVVRSPADVLVQLQKGSTLRTTHSTRMNKMSSRSHAVFTMIVERAQSLSVGKGNDVTIGKLRLVDLAGSERFEADAKGRHIEETKNINTSLYTFGKVILELTSASSKHVPYRDSKLTRILQDSLGGNCKTTMISTISPMSTSYLESLNTLKFAQRAKLVKNLASVNKDTSHQAMISNYEKEIRRLREELESSKTITPLVKADEILLLEKEHQQAQQEKDAAVQRLKQQQKEIRRVESEKLSYVQRIEELEKQVLQGGTRVEETAEFQEAVRKEHHRLQVEAQQNMLKLDVERRRLEKEKEEFEEQKKMLAALNIRSAPDGGRSDEEDESASFRVGRSGGKLAHLPACSAPFGRSPSPESVRMYPAGSRHVVGASTSSASSLRSSISEIDGGPSAASLRSQRTSFSHDSHFQLRQQQPQDLPLWMTPTMQTEVPTQSLPGLLEYAHALSHPLTGIPTQNHPLGVRVFSGDIASRWFLENMMGVLDLDAAQDVGQRLVGHGIIQNITASPEFIISPSELYYFSEKAEHPRVRRGQRQQLQPIRPTSRAATLDGTFSSLSLGSTTSSRRSMDLDRQPSARSARSGHSFTETMASSGNNDSNVSQELLFEELNWQDYGHSPIHTVAALGDRHAVLKLIHENTANCLDSSNRTPLMYAAAANQVKVCQQLMREGGDQMIADNDHMTPILVAAKFGHDKVTKYLLKLYRSSSLATDSHGRNALHYCAAHANLRCLEVALSNALVQRSINERDQAFQTPLHVAVAAGHANHISLLLSAKADPRIGNDRGSSPLHSAILQRQEHCAEVLIRESSCALDMADSEGRTPLHVACVHRSMVVITMLLDSHRCSLDHQDNSRMTGLHLAVQGRHGDAVQLLVSRGAKLTVRDHRGRIPLHYAQEQRNPELVTLLQKSAGTRQKAKPKG